MYVSDKIQLLAMQSIMTEGNTAMNYIELSPDYNWRWIASIVDGTMDAVRRALSSASNR
jgi:hypothetical protein